ncbi:hypothetical protein NDU88_002312 [Pleurodeles waltl]|uniref:Uncharacterized protein n=1 Tax=Pleurodeles waltl TaxID=8319 RepID=A0AAV7SDE4_PLEWA|nr:hypothetical protein NDU88_002312 [Pleurodeles waltl]
MTESSKPTVMSRAIISIPSVIASYFMYVMNSQARNAAFHSRVMQDPSVEMRHAVAILEICCNGDVRSLCEDVSYSGGSDELQGCDVNSRIRDALCNGSDEYSWEVLCP